MADIYDMKSCQFALGTISAVGTTLGLFVPKKTGSITLLSAHLVGVGSGSGTLNSLRLEYFTDAAAGPAFAGTLGTLNKPVGTISPTIPIKFDLDTPYLQPGTQDRWIGAGWTTGTSYADAAIVLTYVMGR